MLEYANSRFTLRCVIATQLPNTMLNAAMTASSIVQPEAKWPQNAEPSNPANPTKSTFSKTKKLATFEPVAIKAVTGVGAPSYASGAHKWNGTTATLNPNPTMVNSIPVTSNGLIPSPPVLLTAS